MIAEFLPVSDYSSIPPQTDILITHSPPVGHGYALLISTFA